MPKPLLALTLGDPAGVGPEVIAGAWPSDEIHRICRPLVIGHPTILQRALELRRVPAQLQLITEPEQAGPTADRIPCLAVGSDDVLDVAPCTVDARSGQAAYDALVCAARLAIERRIDAITTAPLHKAALWQAGHHYPGHTELLAELCGVNDFAMMLYLPPDAQIRSPAGLGVVHVTLHTALRSVFAALTVDAIEAKIHLADTVMRRLEARAGAHCRLCAQSTRRRIGPVR